MDYYYITSVIEAYIVCLLSDMVYTEQQRHDFAYGAYLAWHALVKDSFCKEDDVRLWNLVRYTDVS